MPYILGIASFPVLTEIPLRFWTSVFFVSLISTPLEMILFYKALQKEELSYVVPLLGLGPLLTTLANSLVFHELPSAWGLLGMMIIIFGLYTLNIQKQGENFWAPFRHLVKNQAFKYISLMLISYSIGVVIDKMAITSSDVYFYALVNYLFVSIALYVIARIKAQNHFGQLRANFKPFMLIGLVVAGYTWLRFAALELENAGYVSAVLSTSVIFSIVLGLLFFGENKAMRKLFVGIVILIGLAVIKIYG